MEKCALEKCALTEEPLFRSVNRHGKLQAGRQSDRAVAPAFFLNYQGGRLSARSIDNLMDRVGDEAGVEVPAHVLRHTFATNSIRGGQDLVLVAEMTGHARWRRFAATACRRTRIWRRRLRACRQTIKTANRTTDK